MAASEPESPVMTSTLMEAICDADRSGKAGRILDRTDIPLINQSTRYL